MDTEKIVPLRKPITLGGVEYAHLTLSEPTVKQIIAARKAGIPEEQMAHLIHLNAAVPMVVVQSLAVRDFEECSDFLVRFGGDAWKPLSPSSPASPASTGGGPATPST